MPIRRAAERGRGRAAIRKEEQKMSLRAGPDAYQPAKRENDAGKSDKKEKVKK